MAAEADYSPLQGRRHSLPGVAEASGYDRHLRRLIGRGGCNRCRHTVTEACLLLRVERWTGYSAFAAAT